MAYIGNDLTVAYSRYTNIDDISTSFNGVTTSFALLVNGSAPSPLPLQSNQCFISVGGVIQKPDDTGAEGFRLSGGNIIFSSAPSTGEEFFGVILAGADYVDAGSNFPDGTVGAPSITFNNNVNTGFYRSSSGVITYSSNGAASGSWGSSGINIPSLTSTGRTLIGTASSIPTGDGLHQCQIVANSENILSLWTGENTSQGPFITLVKSRNYTYGGFTICQKDDILGDLVFIGDKGSSAYSAQGARIQALVDDIPSSTSMPGRLVFSTTPTGSTTAVERLRIDSSGDITITSPGKIKADFTNATLASRAYLQSSTTNGSTAVGAIPNGTNNTSSFYTYNSSTPAAAAYGGVAIDGTYVYLRSSRNGAGLTKPLVIQTGDTPTTRMTFDANSYDITIPSTARIRGDFSNGTVASRTCFKTSTANDYTAITALPNGTSQYSEFIAFNNSLESSVDCQSLSMTVTDAGAYIVSGYNGTATAFPIDFVVDIYTCMQLSTGALNINVPVIGADFTNGTLALRTYFQTTTTNGTTSVGAIPNGAGASSAFYAFNSADPTDARYCGVVTDASAGYLRCSRAGSTSTALPLAIQTGATPTTRIQVNADGTTYFPGVGTTASAANAFLNSASSPANQLLRSTSSLRYKTNIENLDHTRADSILDFRPVWYRSKAEADRKDWSWYGLIAEEVAAIEPRLVHWTYLEDAYEEVDGERKLKVDAEMVPDGVQYDRLTVLLLDIVQRQQNKIRDLEARLTAAGI